MGPERVRARGQALAERLMVDRCRVVAVGAPTMDPATGRDVRPETTVQPDGPCLIAERDVEPETADAGERTVYQHDRVVQLPLAAQAPQVGHVVIVLACRADPTLVGRRLTVRAVARGSFATRRALHCEETSG